VKPLSSKETSETHTSWAIITPSYIRDRARCGLLCKSMDAFVIGPWHHYIIVDAPDLKLFADLAGPRRTILCVDDVLERGTYNFLKIPFRSKLSRIWWSWRSGAVAGWQVQQIIKIAMAGLVVQDGMLCCDSDVIFVRELNLDTLVRNGAYRFYHTAEGDVASEGPHHGMVRSSEKYLGLTPKSRRRGYIDNLVTWHRPTVIAMQNHISNVGNRSWQNVLRVPEMISEYTLYGMYVDEFYSETANFYWADESLCKTKWDSTFRSAAEIDNFFSALSPNHVAVGVQSFIDCKIELLQEQFDIAQKRVALERTVSA
jgi:hypothetical protein